VCAYRKNPDNVIPDWPSDPRGKILELVYDLADARGIGLDGGPAKPNLHGAFDSFAG
jgi:hypothetical protein